MLNLLYQHFREKKLTFSDVTKYMNTRRHYEYDIKSMMYMYRVNINMRRRWLTNISSNIFPELFLEIQSLGTTQRSNDHDLLYVNIVP